MTTTAKHRPRLTTRAMKRLHYIWTEHPFAVRPSFAEWLTEDLPTLLDESPEDEDFLRRVRELHPEERRVRSGR